MVDKNKIYVEVVNHIKQLTPPTSQKSTPTKITLDGVQIKLSSGKSLWKRVGDAKSAFRNEFENFWHKLSYIMTGNAHRYITGNYYKEKELKEEIYQYVITNVIRFEPAFEENQNGRD